YLPDEEIRYTSATNTKTCTRFYSFGGGTVAQRTAAGLSWLASDHQGTANLSIDEASQAATVRRQTPFGAPRGTNPAWPNEHGFVGGNLDPTGLTHLGAREYDPNVAAFISPDPLFTPGDPTTFNAYVYAGHNPITTSDPSGLKSRPA